MQLDDYQKSKVRFHLGFNAGAQIPAGDRSRLEEAMSLTPHVAKSFHVELSKVGAARGRNLPAPQCALHQTKCLLEIEENCGHHGRQHFHEMVPRRTRREISRDRY